MTLPVDIKTPELPRTGELTRYVSTRSMDPLARQIVTALFVAFSSRYAGPDLLEAFLEWIIIQLEAVPPEGEQISFKLPHDPT